MSEKKQITKAQHWAPVSHFKHFGNEKGDLQILDKNNWRMCTPRHYSKVCFEEFFYGKKTGFQDEISQKIEDWLGLVEREFDLKFPRIVENIYSTQAIENSHLGLLSVFMSKLWVRSKAFRKETNRLAEESAKDLMAFAASNESYMQHVFDELEQKGFENITPEIRKEGIEMFKQRKYHLKYDNTFHLESLNDVELYANFFYKKKWRIYTLGKGYSFFTSDTPVIEVHPERRTFWGATILERKHYFALSPKILIELSNPDEPGKRVKRKTLKDPEDILQLNLLRIAYSDEYVYTADLEALDYLKQNFSIHH